MIWWLLILVIILGGCGTPNSPPSVVRLALPSGPPLDGAVLGATRDDWVAARGEPVVGTAGERFNDVEVAWTADDERARHIELLFEAEQPVGEARERAKHLFPRDAKVLRTYSGPGGQTVEVFSSQALGEALAAELFGAEQPGTFIMIADRGSPRTARVVLEIGNPA
jgi:hypothetical protein